MIELSIRVKGIIAIVILGLLAGCEYAGNSNLSDSEIRIYKYYSDNNNGRKYINILEPIEKERYNNFEDCRQKIYTDIFEYQKAVEGKDIQVIRTVYIPSSRGLTMKEEHHIARDGDKSTMHFLCDNRRYYNFKEIWRPKL